MEAMGPWTKSSITALVAALSAYFGTLFVSHQAAKSNGEHVITMEYVGIIVITSIVFWLYAAYNMRNHLPGIFPALLLGAASPFIGGFVAGLPFLGVGSLYGVYLAMNSYHLMVPIGMVTGIAVWFINRGVQPTAKTNDVFDSDRLP